MSQERDLTQVIRSKEEIEAANAKLASEGDLKIETSETPTQPLSREERKARLAVVLDRGVVHERLKVDLPPHLHGEWVRRDPMEIDAMRMLGFRIDDTYATKRSIHSDGSSGNQVGDVIFMVTDKENKEMIDEVRLERQLRSARHPKEAQEETEERGGVPGIIPTFSESNQRTVNANDVRAALAKMDGQVRVQR